MCYAFRVTQEPEAVYDVTTDSWHIALKCGAVTPSGDLSSTKYDNGYFYLHLPNPVRGGNYTCILPANGAATGTAGLSPQSSIFVDRVEARLTLLEAEKMALKKKTSMLESELTQYHETRARRVSFHAGCIGDQRVSSFNPVILNYVITNEGGGYNSTTGNFTVPVTGTYALFIAVGTSTANTYSIGHLMVEKDAVCETFSKYTDDPQSSSCQAVVRLVKGQRVWTPSGDLASTKYENGYFYLHLPNPMKGGNYTCILPTNVTATACVSTGAGLSPQSAIFVDRVEARLTLLEAENTALKKQVNQYHAAQALEWTPSTPEEATVYACPGKDRTLNWNYTIAPGEKVEDVKWYYDNGHSSQLVAFILDGTFMVMPGFSGRVRHLGNGGLTIDNVTPSGASVPSTYHKDGNYYLVLDNPLVSGDYSCQLPCDGQKATVSVDEVNGRLTLIEARQGAQQGGLKAEVERQKAELQRQKVELQQQKVELQIQEAELQQQKVELQNQTTDIQQQSMECQKQKVELQNQMTEIQQQNAQHSIELQQQEAELQKQNAVLQNQTTELHQQRVELQKQKMELQQQMTEFQQQRAELQELKVELQNQTKDVQQQNAVLQNQTTELQRQKLQLQQQTTELQLQEAELQQQKVELQNQTTDIQQQRVELQQQKAELQQLKAELAQQKVENADLKQKNTELARQLDQYHGENEELTNQLGNLTHYVHSLDNHLNLYQSADRTSQRVSFHARLSSDQEFSDGDPVILNHVITNEGGAYSPTTGAHTPRRRAWTDLMVDNQPMCYTISMYINHGESSSCQAVVHLVKGQRSDVMKPFSIWCVAILLLKVTGEAVQDIKWNYQRKGNDKQQMVAVSAGGTFLPTQQFSGRVRHLATAGIVVREVSVSDSGNYSVQMDVKGVIGMVTGYSRSVYVDVADAFRLTQEPEAVYDVTTESWHVVLKCGAVDRNGQSNVDVLWRTPSRDLASTTYENGYFYLNVPNPLEGGNYTCILPGNLGATACVPSTTGRSPQSSIFVDKMEARLTVLQAENTAVKKKTSELLTDNISLRKEMKRFHVLGASSNEVMCNTTHVVDVTYG
nr:hypothetical protein BaRGS_032732 [Batillaria attramentaria]